MLSLFIVRILFLQGRFINKEEVSHFRHFMQEWNYLNIHWFIGGNCVFFYVKHLQLLKT